MENGLLAFICKLGLIYYFININENEITPDHSLLNQRSTWTPPFTKNKEFENLMRNLSNILFQNYYRPVEMKKILAGLGVMKYCLPPWLTDEENFPFQIV